MLNYKFRKYFSRDRRASIEKSDRIVTYMGTVIQSVIQYHHIKCKV